jgi:hypothetical protein
VHSYALPVHLRCQAYEDVKSFTATLGNKASMGLVLSGNFVSDRHLVADQHYHWISRSLKDVFAVLLRSISGNASLVFNAEKIE